jgi:hypothetical protein
LITRGKNATGDVYGARLNLAKPRLDRRLTVRLDD